MIEQAATDERNFVKKGVNWALRGVGRRNVALNAAAVNSLADQTVRRKFDDLGFEIPERVQLTPEALGAFQKAEIEKWWPIIRAANIKGE